MHIEQPARFRDRLPAFSQAADLSRRQAVDRRLRDEHGSGRARAFVGERGARVLASGLRRVWLPRLALLAPLLAWRAMRRPHG